MRATISILISSLVLAACAGFSATNDTPDTDPTPAVEYERITFEGERATSEERTKCEAVGGEVRPDGMLGWDNCIQTMPDAGKTCTDSSECVDRCMITGEFADFDQPATGQCAQTDSPFGCYQTVQDGRATPALCVD